MNHAWPAPSAGLSACLDTSWTLAPHLPLRALVLAGVVAVGVWSLARPRFPGQRAFAALHLAMFGWLLAGGIEHAAVAPACRSAVALWQWPALMAVSPLWALFLWQYTQGAPPARARAWGWVAAPVLLMTAIAFTNGWHGALYAAGTGPATRADGATAMVFVRGPMFALAVAWNYALLLWSWVHVARSARDADPATRHHLLAFLPLMTAPWLANAAYLIGGWRPLGADPTPLSFAVATMGFAWLIARRGLFDAVPLAYRRLFDHLPDAVLVVDRHQRVIAANAAAAAAARATTGTAVPARGGLLRDWPDLGADLAAFEAAGAGPATTVVERGPRAHELRREPLGHGEQRVGSLLVLRDVTDRVRAQRGLERALEAQALQLRHVEALQAQLIEQALRDPLTGLWNRRALPGRFAEVSAGAARRSLAVAVIDVDHFKRVNDEHGHAAGDAVLQALAAELPRSQRPGELQFRIGGEEFLLLMPDTDAAQAAARVDALRARLRERRPDAARGIAIGLSAGVAAWPGDARSLDALMRAADRALYRAKAAGRDRVFGYDAAIDGAADPTAHAATAQAVR